MIQTPLKLALHCSMSMTVLVLIQPKQVNAIGLSVKKGLYIKVITQPPLHVSCPDCNDLMFCASLQSDTELVAKSNVVDLVVEAV